MYASSCCSKRPTAHMPWIFAILLEVYTCLCTHVLKHTHKHKRKSHKHKVRPGVATPKEKFGSNLLKHSPCDKDLDLGSVGNRQICIQLSCNACDADSKVSAEVTSSGGAIVEIWRPSGVFHLHCQPRYARSCSFEAKLVCISHLPANMNVLNNAQSPLNM